MGIAPILTAEGWVRSKSTTTFRSINPTTGEEIPVDYPVSNWEELDAMARSAERAYQELCRLPHDLRADFLDRLADRLEARKGELVTAAHEETALPVEPRLASVELPRTTNQLRLGAATIRERSAMVPTIDSKLNIRSIHGSLGPVAVFGPNNFPFAFNSVAGGDFAAALVAGNPVLAKANTSHPGVTRLLAEEARRAADETSLPAGTIQMVYRTRHEDGERWVAHPLLAATCYTGSRSAGMTLRDAARAAGKLFYAELSSVNPVVILPGALRQRGPELAKEYVGSLLMGMGQFCTNPGLVFVMAGTLSEDWLAECARLIDEAPAGTLLSPGVERSLADSVKTLERAGAERLSRSKRAAAKGCSYPHTLLKVHGERFQQKPVELQTEAFGNAGLVVVCRDGEDMAHSLTLLEGNLTGTIYCSEEDDALYDRLEPALRRRVGRLLNNKMPTGVAVSSAMNHGGPFPATDHPGFTAVGFPAAALRLTALQCYDNVPDRRLPPELRDHNLPSRPWRLIDGQWTRGDVGQH